MKPQRQLVVSVSIVAAVIFVAWLLLLSKRVLIPEVEPEESASFREVIEQFDEQVGVLNAQLDALREPMATPGESVPSDNVDNVQPEESVRQ
ncbi:MAG: hypothetical protein ABIG71_01520 [Candidatus Uhrbacteria bacterium]